MRTIEAQLHELLLDIAPEQHDIAEQAKIIAEASAIFAQITVASKRTAGRTSESSGVHEARMMDALLQSLASYESDDDDFGPGYIDGVGLDPHEIVRSAMSSGGARRTSSKNFGSMDILNDDDLSIFLSGSDDHDDDEYDINDSIDEELHPLDVFTSPGNPRHRSDSQIR